MVCVCVCVRIWRAGHKGPESQGIWYSWHSNALSHWHSPRKEGMRQNLRNLTSASGRVPNGTLFPIYRSTFGQAQGNRVPFGKHPLPFSSLLNDCGNLIIAPSVRNPSIYSWEKQGGNVWGQESLKTFDWKEAKDRVYLEMWECIDGQCVCACVR